MVLSFASYVDGSEPGHVLRTGTAVALAAGTFYLVAVAIYRLYFHPLARFPGPIFARLTPIPCAISLLRGRMPMWVKHCHDKYGPVVRVSPNELAFDEELAWKVCESFSSSPCTVLKFPSRKLQCHLSSRN
jgi:hypothetical protein